MLYHYNTKYDKTIRESYHLFTQKSCDTTTIVCWVGLTGLHTKQGHVTQHGCTGKSNMATLACEKGGKVITLSCDIGQGGNIVLSKYCQVWKCATKDALSTPLLALPGSGMSQITSRKLFYKPPDLSSRLITLLITRGV